MNRSDLDYLLHSDTLPCDLHQAADRNLRYIDEENRVVADDVVGGKCELYVDLGIV